jgi:hypothetical protein
MAFSSLYINECRCINGEGFYGDVVKSDKFGGKNNKITLIDGTMHQVAFFLLL